MAPLPSRMAHVTRTCTPAAEGTTKRANERSTTAAMALLLLHTLKETKVN